MDKNSKVPGFRVGDYFVSFPEDEFIKEEKETGQFYVLADIYKLDKDGNAFKIEQEDLTPDIEELISSEINKMLTSAIDEMGNTDK